jgi:Flp pilus assembly protein TadG
MKDMIFAIAVKMQILRWAQEERATALIETVILFPVLITLMMGCYDLGQGITVNQKTIAASQIIGDLIARDRSVTLASLEEIITAGELAFEPYTSAPFGYDIVSIQFDADGDPVVLWRVTENAEENEDAVESTEGLGGPGEGVLIVTAVYNYNPYFANFVVDEINMREVAFLRGRRSSTITCDDCPSS